LIFLGYPASVANGTNRVGILIQNVGAVWGFHRYRALPWRLVLWTAIPAVAGSGLGTWAALVITDEWFRRLLAVLMVAVTLWTLLSSDADGSQPTPRQSRSELLALSAAFFAVGIYGGFVQAGVGFFVLAATTWAGLDLVRGNALKVLCILAFTVLSLGLFAWNGLVAWAPGLALGAGTLIGGQAGVKLTVLKGHRWIRVFVTVTVLVFAAKLLLMG
jgi:uncharacterized membrane protein YfcA